MEIEARSMEIRAGNILAWPQSVKLPEQLGANEFFGMCVPYSVPSDSGEAIAAGAIDCDGYFIVMHEHAIPVGICKLIAMPEGIFAHGRLVNNTGTSASILLAMRLFTSQTQKALFHLCLSTTRERKEVRVIGNRECVVTLEGRPRELSVCLFPGFPNTHIRQIGPLEIKPSEWDQRFFPGGLGHLLQASAEHCGLYAKIRQREYEQFTEKNRNGGSYEEFINSLSF